MIPSTLLLSLLATSAADDVDSERVQAFIDEEGLPDVRLLQKQLGVHSAHRKAGQAQQADADDMMLFQSHAKVVSQNLLQEMNKSKKKNTAEVKAMVEKLAAEVSKGETAIDETTRDALNSMKKTLEDTSELTLRSSHAEDQSLLQRHADAVEACGAHFRDDKVEEVALAAEVSSKEMLHVDSRSALRTNKNDQSMHCENLDNLHKSLIPPTCAVPAAVDELKHFLSAIATWSKTNFRTWNELYALCTDATNVYSTQVETSDSKQMYYEGDFCQYRLALHEDCYTNSMCYNVAVQVFEQTKEVALANAESRKLEWTAIQKIKCYVDVLVDDTSETNRRQDGMNACQVLAPDTSHLDINVPPLPEKEPCDFSNVVEYPGSSEFRNKYSGMTDVHDTLECAPLEDHLVNLQARKANHLARHLGNLQDFPSCTASNGEQCFLKENNLWKPEDIPPYFECLGKCCQDYDATRIFDGITCLEILGMGLTCDSDVPGGPGHHIPAGTKVSDICCATCSTQRTAGTADKKPPPATYGSSSSWSSSSWPSTGSSSWDSMDG